MTLVLTVEEGPWRSHVDRVVERVGSDSLIAVVKGNGYGFGRAWLAAFATRALGIENVAVGTMHELADTSGIAQRTIVLTPSLDVAPSDLPDGAVLTIGSPAQAAAHCAAPDADARPVVVKLRTSMQRHGLLPEEWSRVRDSFTIESFALHFPLVGTDAEHVAEIEAWLPALPAGATLDVSHLGASAFERLRDTHRDRTFRLRLGTSLWHGDKSMLTLSADVLDTRPITAGERAGYRSTTAPYDGHLVLVGAGTANGVHPLADGRSPFHFARRRLDLLEAPHMHTSMVLVPHDAPVPATGGTVDVQRPLTMVSPDRVVWLR
jgi:alanine racemase